MDVYFLVCVSGRANQTFEGDSRNWDWVPRKGDCPPQGTIWN